MAAESVSSSDPSGSRRRNERRRKGWSRWWASIQLSNGLGGDSHYKRRAGAGGETRLGKRLTQSLALDLILCSARDLVRCCLR